jgi:phosphoglycerol transferase MdoB-like AlkP superfamily enzyme
MIRFFVFAVKHLVFWLTYFILLQVLFLILFRNELSDLPYSPIFYSFRSGLALHLSAAAYCTMAAVLAVYLINLFKKRGTNLLLFITAFLLLICFLIYSTDLALYHNWGTRINGKALWYLNFPGTVTLSAGNIGHLIFIVGVFSITFPAWIFYKKFLNKVPDLGHQPLKSTILFLSLTALLFITLRGGIKGRPISKAQCYYSNKPVLNYAAINGFWNFFDIVSHYKPQGNAYHFFSEKMLLNKDSIFESKLSSSWTRKLSQVEKPNILFIYLESWGADVVACLGGHTQVTPMFDKLAHESILFTKYYSTGFRTEQGLMATLSGFPAQAQTYPMEDMERFENYPNLIHDLKEVGYYTSYFTGGNPEFANTSVYLKSAGIHQINSDLLAKAKRRSAWGALDEETFDWTLNKLNQQSTPFFSSMVTLTSHEWFEAPVKRIFNEKDQVCTNYKNTVHYTDSCLYDFMSKAKKQNWYKNTLIFIISDHACNYPYNRSMNDPERYHIPMMITGGALKEELLNTKHSEYKSHLNIPGTIIRELNLKLNSFQLSSHVLDSNGFAYFTYDHGFGIMNAEGQLVYDCNLGKPTLISSPQNKGDLLELGEYLMQKSAQMKEDYKTKKSF